MQYVLGPTGGLVLASEVEDTPNISIPMQEAVSEGVSTDVLSATIEALKEADVAFAAVPAEVTAVPVLK